LGRAESGDLRCDAPKVHGARCAGGSSEPFGAEALWSRGARGFFGATGVESLGCGVGALGSWCRGFREETFEVLRGRECRSFGAEVSASFGMSGAEALESRCRRLFRVLGALSFLESWCGRLHWGSRCHGFFGAWGRQLCSCGAHVAQTAISEKARELVQVSGLGDESARLWIVNALEAGRLGEGWRFRRQRSGRETSRATVLGEPRTAVWRSPGGASNPKRGAVAGEV